MTVAYPTVDDVQPFLERLDGVKKNGTGWTARCPAHDDGRASLSISEGETGKLLAHCHAGCSFESIITAAALPRRAISPIGPDIAALRARAGIVAEYDYTDENGALLFQAVRLDPKDFRQRKPDGRGGWTWRVNGVRRVPYHLAEVIKAAAQGRPIFVTEGEKDADNLRARGVPATTNAGGAGKWSNELSAHFAGCPLVVVLPDNDEPGEQHAERVAQSLRAVVPDVRIVRLPGLPPKGDVSDWLGAGGTVEQLKALAEEQAVADTAPVEASLTLSECRAVFHRWFGKDYEAEGMEAMLCTLAAERLTGDPLWLLLISGSGNAKTETVQAARGVGAIVISTINSEGALLSGTAARERTKGATGGLLRTVGDRGVLVIKDFTTIISAHRDTRAALLAAFREIHDGYWSRSIGSDGGKMLEWKGRIAVIGAVTTAWDRAHDVIAAMGDRFVLVRLDSTRARPEAGRCAMDNVGAEEQMRAELAEAVAGVMRSLNTEAELTLSNAETQIILDAADLVTRARTGVDYDYRGDVIDAHAPEMPTRFAKQLTQLMRGGIALGMGRTEALALAIRCARDSMPPLRLAILLDVAKHPNTKTHDVRKRLGKPRATVDRQLQSLHMLGLLTCAEEEDTQLRSVWRYTVATDFRPEVLYPKAVPELSPHGDTGIEESDSGVYLPADISGTEYEAVEREALGGGL